MSKYEPMYHFLRDIDDTHITMSFSEIEDVLGFNLPASARRYNAWWANQAGEGHSQTTCWQEAGWKTSNVDLDAESVVFSRSSGLSERAAAVADSRRSFHSETGSLFARAAELTGISGRDALIEAGLKALIAREAAFRLAAMGGTMPNLSVPDRRRPDQ